ncbi:hypothetical protein [Paenibacillus glucanolyticus]|uniref:hypothetical protein n=1 Tax=Paenibacillus glucanolyticus TaxID=59843 RepID=UPI000A7031DA|nr:hypothetical protein [Paenibacillus glucanolyticus]
MNVVWLWGCGSALILFFYAGDLSNLLFFEQFGGKLYPLEDEEVEEDGSFNFRSQYFNW